MARLIALGSLAALLFSSTFVLNRWLAVEGAHWYWTAALRYYFVSLLVTGILLVRLTKAKPFKGLVSCYWQHWKFWSLAGGIGFGAFYLQLCWAASFAPGWVVAATWQLTILMSPIVLRMFGVQVPLRGLLLLAAAFAGIVFINYNSLKLLDWEALTAIALVGSAAFCYPMGNTLVGFARHGNSPKVLQIDHWAMHEALTRVWLMTVGAIPILVLVGILVKPGWPTLPQLVAVFFVAVTTGVLATGVFLSARHHAKTGAEIAAVDATQTLEVPFALAIELLLFSGAAPTGLQIVGMFVVVIAVGGFPIVFRKNAA